MVLITVFFVTILGYLNIATADLVAFNQRAVEQEKILKAFGLYNESIEASLDQFFTREINKDDRGFYTAKTPLGKTIGLGFEAEGRGVWGPMRIFIVLDEELKSLIGIEILSHSETPGLGARIEEELFLNQFRNLSLVEGEQPIFFTPHPQGSVDAISGATGSSRALLNTLNTQINVVKTKLSGVN
jgi:Na+-transporting NADH:ubiquinone oxidoreductase subunit C